MPVHRRRCFFPRKGERVLVIDHGTFRSDTVFTHILQLLVAATLARCGFLDRLTDVGCPPIDTNTCDFGPFVLGGEPPADR